jgi:hypothetical protein
MEALPRIPTPTDKWVDGGEILGEYLDEAASLTLGSIAG